jgi:hypothetical protein
MILFKKVYDDESLYDLSRDVEESLDGGYNSLVENIPYAEDGFRRGKFTVTIEWEDEE